jgi:hypothetical protein
MKTMPLPSVANRQDLVCNGDGSSLLLIEHKNPREGTIQAALKAAEKLPDLSDADFDDLENCVLHRG